MKIGQIVKIISGENVGIYGEIREFGKKQVRVFNNKIGLLTEEISNLQPIYFFPDQKVKITFGKDISGKLVGIVKKNAGVNVWAVRINEIIYHVEEIWFEPLTDIEIIADIGRITIEMDK